MATHLPSPCLFPETHAPKPRRQNVDDQGKFVPSSSKIQVETVLSSRGWEGGKTQPLSSSSSPPLFFLFPEKPKNRSPSSSTTRCSPSRSATCCLWPSRTSSVSFFFSVFAFSFVWREREEKVLGEGEKIKKISPFFLLFQKLFFQKKTFFRRPPRLLAHRLLHRPNDGQEARQSPGLHPKIPRAPVLSVHSRPQRYAEISQ